MGACVLTEVCPHLSPPPRRGRRSSSPEAAGPPRSASVDGNAGSAVFHVGRKDANLAALTELFGQVWREPFMVQAFLPDVAKGDKRIVLVDGKVAGAINRLVRV